jgi:hypothetical protein
MEAGNSDHSCAARKRKRSRCRNAGAHAGEGAGPKRYGDAADLARLDSGVGQQLLDHREEPLRMATAAELPGAERPINTLRVTPEQCCRDGAEAGIESENG